ncbi:MAG: glycosyltransferase family 2 protein [Pseudomonadota bacterium]
MLNNAQQKTGAAPEKDVSQVDDLGDLLRARPKGKLGALRQEGADLEGLIARETNLDVLKEALNRADACNDYFWAMHILKRMVAEGADHQLRIELMYRLVGAKQFEEAKHHLALFAPGQVEPDKWAVWNGCVAIHDGSETDQQKAHDAMVAHLADITPEQILVYTRKLQAHGHWDKCESLLKAAMGLHPLDVDLVKAYVELQLFIGGGEAAQEALVKHAAVLKRRRGSYLEANHKILIFTGRLREAAVGLADQLAQDPQLGALYYPLRVAAAGCDQPQLYAAAIDRLSAQDGTHLTVLEHKIQELDNYLDPEKADAILSGIRDQAEVQYQIHKMVYFANTNDPEGLKTQVAEARSRGIDACLICNVLGGYHYYYTVDLDGLREVADAYAAVIHQNLDDASSLILYMRILMALDRTDDLMALWNTLPEGMKTHHEMVPFDLCFQAADGDDDAVKSGWVRALRDSRHAALSSETHRPLVADFKYTTPQETDVLLFGVVRDGIEYADWFLSYYRALGVAHFFIVDNGSEDGTFEYLKDQPDVSLFHQPQSFSKSRCGIFWVNDLLKSYGVGHWCLNVDIDEALVFAGSDKGKTIHDFVGFLDREGAETSAGFMLDIYPASLERSDTENGFDRSEYIDLDYQMFPCEYPPYTYVKGGIRGRMSGRHLLMTKAPLIKMGRETCYLTNNHYHTHLKVSQMRCAVLHYKFVGDIVGRVDDAIEQQEHFNGATFYKSLKPHLAMETLLDQHSERYGGTDQLIELKYLNHPKGW